jgi:hypothetical protein
MSVLSVVERLPQAVANREVVETLESYLADAKSGRIASMAIAAITADGEALTVATRTDDRMRLLGSLTRLIARINATIDADDTEAAE